MKSYQNYGGRGIRVCERWDDFAVFFADMGPRPSPQHTIERIDNDGDYEPSNCRWATRKEQAQNRRTAVYLESDGLRLSISEWSRRTGMPFNRIWWRLNHGWPVERILSV